MEAESCVRNKIIKFRSVSKLARTLLRYTQGAEHISEVDLDLKM